MPSSYSQIATTLAAAVNQSAPFWLGASAVTAAMIMFGTVNYNSGKKPTVAVSPDRYETLVYRQPIQDAPQSFEDRWGSIAYAASEDDGADGHPRAIQTVRVAKTSTRIESLAFASASTETPATFSLASLRSEPVAPDTAVDPETKRALARMDEVEQYLWEVYQRAPTKKDGSGDFTWKDPAAAKRFGKSMPAYVISGMDPDFREQLYHAGKAMDAAGIQWAILSAFRDDYRQSLASGFKASARNSLHGGSARTGGYGHGRAVDVTSADDHPEAVWKWLDAHGAKYGLHRPMPGADPAHVQSRGEWRRLAQGLREARVRIAEARGEKNAPSGKTKVAASAR